jgi:putative sigma-54 modulation protein
MELQISGQNIELTPAIRSYVERKMGKLTRHFPSIIEAIVEIAEEKTRSPQQQFLIRVNVLGDGIRLHGEQRGDDLFKAVDKVSAVMIRQLEDEKGKLYEKHKGVSLARSEPALEETPRTAPEVVKVKRFAMKPMSVAEGARQMELLGHSFFLFLNADTEELNLLYKRKDGNYGLIETERG